MQVGNEFIDQESNEGQKYMTIPRSNKTGGSGLIRVDSKTDMDSNLGDEPNSFARNLLTLSRSQSLNNTLKRWSMVPALLRVAYEAIPVPIALIDYEKNLLLFTNKFATKLLLGKCQMSDTGLPLSQFLLDNERFLLIEAQNRPVVLHWQLSRSESVAIKIRVGSLPRTGFVTNQWMALTVLCDKWDSAENCDLLPNSADVGLEDVIPATSPCGSETPQTPSRYFSRYQVEFEELGVLGNGGFGRVTRVRNRLDGMEYAIKIVKLRGSLDDFLPTGRDSALDGSGATMHSRHISDSDHRLLREVKMFARISHHPNIVRYYNAWIEAATDSDDDIESSSGDDGLETVGSGSDGDWSSIKRNGKPQAALYIQMQLCPYKDLRAWLEDRGHDIEQWTNLKIFRQIVQALHHCHSQDVVHRDLKPENIFINEDCVLLGDFGLATQLEGMAALSASNSEPANIASPVGTLTYAPPEVLSQRPVHDPTRSDIYSLGILLFELFVPFDTGMERAQVLQKLKNNFFLPVSLVENYPAEASLIASLLATNPDQRPCTNDILSHEVFHRLDDHENELQLSDLLSKTALTNGLMSYGSASPLYGRRSRALSIHSSLLYPVKGAVFPSFRNSEELDIKELHALSAPASGLSSPISANILPQFRPGSMEELVRVSGSDDNLQGTHSPEATLPLVAAPLVAAPLVAEPEDDLLPNSETSLSSFLHLEARLLPKRTISISSVNNKQHSRSRSDVSKPFGRRKKPFLPLLNLDFKQPPSTATVVSAKSETKEPASLSAKLEFIEKQLKDMKRRTNELKKEKLTMQLQLGD